MAETPNPALQSWPYDLLGKPLKDPGAGAIDPVIRTPMEDGFKSRLRFQRPIQTGRYSVLMSNEQFNFFKAWHLHKIHAGNDWFNFQVRAGDSLSWEEVKMSGIYQTTPAHNKFVTVSFEIVQRTDSIPSESELDAALS